MPNTVRESSLIFRQAFVITSDNPGSRSRGMRFTSVYHFACSKIHDVLEYGDFERPVSALCLSSLHF